MIRVITALDAILALDPTAKVSIHGQEITWHDGNPKKITGKQITQKIQELETRENSLSVQQEAKDRLSACDHWAYQDTDPMTKTQKDYRKELREIIQKAETDHLTLESVTWPSKP